MGTLQRIGQGIKKFFKPPRKINLSELNSNTKNTPAHGHGGASGKGSMAPGAGKSNIRYGYGVNSPIKKSYRCGRGFLTQSKPQY